LESTALSLSIAFLGGSVWTMIAEAGFFAQLILIILFVFSVTSWAIIFMKWKLFRVVVTDGAQFRASFHRGRRLADRMKALGNLRHTPHWRLIDAGLQESLAFTNQNRGGESSPDAWYDLTSSQKQAVGDTLTRVSQEEIGKLESWTIFLATVGNASPFLGLLGTVWGIMDSFIGIGVTGSASLAVVAPGIAEALIATAAGLAAAIPAVVAYNWSIRKLRQIGDDLSNLSLEFLTELTKENAREATDISRAV
jgi:biopolymer transport protein TolQ